MTNQDQAADLFMRFPQYAENMLYAAKEVVFAEEFKKKVAEAFAAKYDYSFEFFFDFGWYTEFKINIYSVPEDKFTEINDFITSLLKKTDPNWVCGHYIHVNFNDDSERRNTESSKGLIGDYAIRFRDKKEIIL